MASVDKKEMTTNLSLSIPLRRRIERHAKADGRTLKAQIRVLVAEAMDRREATKLLLSRTRPSNGG